LRLRRSFAASSGISSLWRRQRVLEQIPDDPIVSSIIRTGYPPWLSESSVADRMEEEDDLEEDKDEL